MEFETDWPDEHDGEALDDDVGAAGAIGLRTAARIPRILAWIELQVVVAAAGRDLQHIAGHDRSGFAAEGHAGEVDRIAGSHPADDVARHGRAVDAQRAAGYEDDRAAAEHGSIRKLEDAAAADGGAAAKSAAAA